MNLSRFITVALFLIGFGFANSSVADSDIVEGKDYTRLVSPQPTQSGDKIEVLEFFWYGCPHCNALHPYIKTWLESMPEDVDFNYVPAILRANWVAGAKIFYTLEVINATEELHDKVYAALHNEKVNLNKESILFDWVEKQGVEREVFVDAYESFAIQNKVSRSTQMSRQYKLSGTPALVVDGKYLTSGSMGGTAKDTIRILNKLIEKARQDRVAG